MSNFKYDSRPAVPSAQGSAGSWSTDRLMAGDQMRHVTQPGEPVKERIRWVEARGHAFAFTLPRGAPLLEAVRHGFDAAGFASGTLSFKGCALGPLAYVMPALPRTTEH